MKKKNERSVRHTRRLFIFSKKQKEKTNKNNRNKTLLVDEFEQNDFGDTEKEKVEFK